MTLEHLIASLFGRFKKNYCNLNWLI